MTQNPSATFVGNVEKIIQPLIATEPGKAQIAVEGADHLHRELRIDNTLTDAGGNEFQLKPGAKVEVTVKAVSEDVPQKVPAFLVVKNDV